MNSGFTLQGGELGHGHVPRRGRAVPIPRRRETASRVLQLGGDRSPRGTSAQGAGVASGRVRRPGLQAAVREEGRSPTWTARAGRWRRDVRAAVACRTREGPARGHGDRPPSVCSRARPAGVAVPSPSWLSWPERGRRPGGRRQPAGPASRARVYRWRRRHRRSWRRRPHDGLTGPGDRGRGSDQRLPAGLALRRRSGL